MTEDQARKLKAIFDTGEYLILLSDDLNPLNGLADNIAHDLRYEADACEGDLMNCPREGVTVAKIIEDWENI